MNELRDTLMNELRELRSEIASCKLGKSSVACAANVSDAAIELDADAESVGVEPLVCSGNAEQDAPEEPAAVVDPQAPADEGIFKSKVTCKLSDLLRGDLAPHTWQFTQFKNENATWLAAGQRRHMHRRRLNVLTSVASVDLSGPHDPR